MAKLLKQSTAVDVPIGPFLDSTDGVTAETGLTISQADVRLKKNDGAWAQKNESTSATHEENGNYECKLDATDTNTLGHLRLHVAESGALPVWHDFTVVPANVYDSWVLGTDKVQVDVAEWLGTAAATPTVAGVPEVDLTHVAGTAATAASGIPEVKVASIANNAITAASINADAITAAKIADGAIDAATFAAGAINAAAIANGAIDAATFAAGAIDAASLAADAGTEIAAAVLAATVDGVALSTVLTRMYAAVAGDVAISGSGPYTFEFDGPAGTVIITSTADAGERTNVYA